MPSRPWSDIFLGHRVRVGGAQNIIGHGPEALTLSPTPRFRANPPPQRFVGTLALVFFVFFGFWGGGGSGGGGWGPVLYLSEQSSP